MLKQRRNVPPMVPTRYYAEHIVLPWAAFSSGTVEFLSSESVSDMYTQTYELKGSTFPYTEKDFQVRNKMIGEMAVTIITPPAPSNRNDCHKIFIVPEKDNTDKATDKVKWYITLEATNEAISDINQAFLSRWEEKKGDKRLHHNYGPMTIIKAITTENNAEDAALKYIYGMFQGCFREEGITIFDAETGKFIQGSTRACDHNKKST